MQNRELKTRWQQIVETWSIFQGYLKNIEQHKWNGLSGKKNESVERVKVTKKHIEYTRRCKRF